MENNDGNNKSQQTGGLKLMTVFIAVLALHVVVIGGFTVYHLMSGGNTDVDVTFDKTHVKADGTAIADGAVPDANKPATTDGTTAPATTVANPDASSTSETTPTTTPAPIPASAEPTASKPVAPAVVTTMPAPTPVLPPPPISSATPSGVILNPNTPVPEISSLAPPPEPPINMVAPEPMTPAPVTTAPVQMAPVHSAPVAAGPVHMPATTMASAATHTTPITHTAETTAKKEFYTVQITDSYKKIAKAHHITVAQLKEANHIKDNTLHTGEKLIIPAGKSSLAKADAEPATNLAGSPSGTTSHHKFYTVEKGDTLAYIAKKFNTTKTALIAANDISNPAKLAVGRKLKIPASKEKEARSATTTFPTAAPVTPVAQPAPVAQPVMAPQPVATQPTSPQPEITPELANMTF